MAFAIARVGKLAGWGKVSAAGGHNLRTRQTPNADEKRTPQNVLLAGSPDLVAAVKGRMADAGVTPGRKDAVLCSELFLGASPEWFKGKTPAEVRTWANANVAWLREKHGENLVQASLHLDETTPHIHAMIVPINVDGTLTAKRYWGERAGLKILQSEYASVMKPFGLERGIERSAAQHKTIKEFYGEVEQSRNRAERLKKLEPKVEPPKTIPVLGVVVWTKEEAMTYADEQAREHGRQYRRLVDPVSRANAALHMQNASAISRAKRAEQELTKERNARQRERSEMADDLDRGRAAQDALQSLVTYAPAELKAATQAANERYQQEQEQERQRRAEQQRQQQEQARRVVALQPPQPQRVPEPEPAAAPRRGYTFRR